MTRTIAIGDIHGCLRALDALLGIHRRAEIDGAYSAYDAHPLDEPDEWGDLASFRSAASAS